MCAVIGRNVITSQDVAAGQIKTSDIFGNAITSPLIAPDSVVTSDIADGAIRTPQIADDAVKQAKIEPLSINSQLLAPDSIQSQHLAAFAVLAGHIQNDAIQQQHVDDAAISQTELEATPGALITRTEDVTRCGLGFEAVTFTAEAYDSGGLANLGANNTRLTIPVAGVYSIGGTLSWEGDANGSRHVLLFVNGAPVDGNDRTPPGSSPFTMAVSRTAIHLNAGDTVTLQATHLNSGGPTCGGGVFRELDIQEATLTAQWESNP